MVIDFNKYINCVHIGIDNAQPYQRLPNEIPTFGATAGPWVVKKFQATPPCVEIEKFRLVRNFTPNAKPTPNSVKGFIL